MAKPTLTPTGRKVVQARIMAAIDRAFASPYADDPSDGVVSCVGSMILTLGDRSETFDGWDKHAVRAVVEAYAEGAPPQVLDALDVAAARQLAWVEWWDSEGHDEARRPPKAARRG